MPRDNSGNYTPLSNSVSPAVPFQTISSDDWNAQLTDMATALDTATEQQAEDGISGAVLMSPLNATQHYNARIGTTRFTPAFHKFGGQLFGLHNSLTDPFTQFTSLVLVGDSITWGLTLPDNAPTTPRDRTLGDPRDDYVSSSWANQLKRYISLAYFNEDAGTLTNFDPLESGESTVTFTKDILLYPGIDGEGFTTFQSGGSTSTSNLATGGAKLGYRFLMADGNAGGTSVIERKFNFTGKKITIWYTSIAAQTCDYDLYIDGVVDPAGPFSTNNGTDTNGLSRTHTFDYIHDKEIIIRLSRSGIAAVTQYVELEAIGVEKTCQIINQGIIGADTRSYLEFCLTGSYPIVSPLPPAVSDEDMFVIIQLGTNDRAKFTIGAAPNNFAHGVLTFKNRLEANMDRIEVINPDVTMILMCSTPSDEENPAIYDFTMSEVRDIILQVGRERTTDVIDNYAILRGVVLSEYLADGLHPNLKGHTAIARNIIGAIELSASA